MLSFFFFFRQLLKKKLLLHQKAFIHDLLWARRALLGIKRPKAPQILSWSRCFIIKTAIAAVTLDILDVNLDANI